MDSTNEMKMQFQAKSSVKRQVADIVTALLLQRCLYRARSRRQEERPPLSSYHSTMPHSLI